MKNFVLYLFFGFVLISCKTTQSTKKNTKYRKPIILRKDTNSGRNRDQSSVLKVPKFGKTVVANGTALEVLEEAKSYLGTKYQYGGFTKSGIDCSGLVCNAYTAVDVAMERRSVDQSKQGIAVNLIDIKPADLLFFNTSGNGISHAGIVESIKNDEIFFIHASTSKGVIISSLEDKYWKPRFVIARRVLEL